MRINDWNIIRLIQNNTSNDVNNDMVFETILKEVDSRISKKIVSTLHGAMTTDYEQTNGCYYSLWIRKPFTPQENKFIERLWTTNQSLHRWDHVWWDF